MSDDFYVVIPSRYGASRLPSKPLLDIGGRTLLQHVFESASASKAKKVIIATDDERIEDLARSFGAEVIMTSSDHASGTDRIAEVVKRKDLDAGTIVVNVQGDEFNLAPALINQVADNLSLNKSASIATLCEALENASLANDPATVKVVRDVNNYAMYFSRSLLPWQEDPGDGSESFRHYKHLGLYAYRAGFLKKFTDLPQCDLERKEKLEQLRALYNGFNIHVDEACERSGIGVDTEEDLARARAMIAGK